MEKKNHGADDWKKLRETEIRSFIAGDLMTPEEADLEIRSRIHMSDLPIEEDILQLRKQANLPPNESLEPWESGEWEGGDWAHQYDDDLREEESQEFGPSSSALTSEDITRRYRQLTIEWADYINRELLHHPAPPSQ